MDKYVEKGYKLVSNENGPTLGYTKAKILEVDGLYFKDLNNNGFLDAYEDWRLPIEVRIKDLVKKMSIRQMAGLMLYSKHQTISSSDDLFSKMFAGKYDGKLLLESGKTISDLTDQQKDFLIKDELRHVLITNVDSAKVAAKWSNNIQTLAESLGLGIPVNVSSDPRHSPIADSEFNAGAGGMISFWPETLGLAATFDPKIAKRFGEVAAKEYRAMGITTALSPQVDLATDPRWMRFNGTFGEDTNLTIDFTKAYIDGFQTSNTENGWGFDSVNAMVKHWPGGGSGEAGRDAHYRYGKFAVYPGDNFEEHLLPFTKGAFNLKGKTKQASAIMPYYTISYDQDKKYGENVGNAYSKYLIKDLLRGNYKYDGVVCTDWLITQDNQDFASFLSGKSWGVEDLSEAQRHYKLLVAGVDQFGGNNEIQPVLDAFDIGVKNDGQIYMRKRFEKSASRLLRNIFQTGLFENPYLDENRSQAVVANPKFMEEGFIAQIKSVVMLKNDNKTLPIQKGKKVYIPKRIIDENVDWFGNVIPAHSKFPVSVDIVNKYYEVVTNPKAADFALIFIESPATLPYTKEAGFLPISLQYQPYTALKARTKALANEESEDRSYLNKSNTPSNSKDLDIILETRKMMPDKDIIVVKRTANPTIVAEFEPYINGLLLDFNVQTQAILEVISGNFEPQAMLPFQMPKDMETVEKQMEDVGHDMDCYVDSNDNTYDFGFGLNYKGQIKDERYKKYVKYKYNK
ncbi:MAG: glycoside hydrolase family 3 protein [Erysipelothrix sp.]|nr:glycoside hydrolase family 3 protein [Erysipelothrix sp.]